MNFANLDRIEKLITPLAILSQHFLKGGGGDIAPLPAMRKKNYFRSTSNFSGAILGLRCGLGTSSVMLGHMGLRIFNRRVWNFKQTFFRLKICCIFLVEDDYSSFKVAFFFMVAYYLKKKTTD